MMMVIEAMLMVCSLLLLCMNGQLTMAVDSVCSQSTTGGELTVDVFTELLSNHTELLKNIAPAPVVGNMDPNSPAFEFRGSGVHLFDRSLSNTIRQYSCSSNEITLRGSVFFKQPDSSGPIVELSYADSFGPSLPVFSMRMDALADEIIVAYRHLGNLHTEVFPVRLVNGRWRRYAVTLSGNQALVYDSCELIHQRLVPLPDYCANDNAIILSVADSPLETDNTNMMFAFLQDVAIHFGSRGIQQVCPDIPEACPSCGRFLRMVEKVYGLNQEVEYLRSRVAELESQECVALEADCTHTFENEETVEISHGDFHFRGQTVCFCSAGEVTCTDQLIVEGTTEPPTTSDSSQEDAVATPAPDGVCAGNSIRPDLRLNETYYMKSPTKAECTQFSCQTGIFGNPEITETPMECPTGKNCSTFVTQEDRDLAICCRICDPCSFITCGDDSVCMVEDNGMPNCMCLPGFKSGPTPNSCVDLNECNETSLCSSANTVCSNSVGSYSCSCEPGYSMMVSPRGFVSCEDNDECLSPRTNNCTGDTVCQNTNGGFVCVCPEGNIQTDAGVCESSCDPPCLNGGTCVRGGCCDCHPGYTGEQCESDVNECENDTRNNCNSDRGVCINTMGGYFCRCQAGFIGNGSHCEDVDECQLDLDNCLDEARCVNIEGGFQCLCGDEICTGYCLASSKRKDIIIPNKESLIVENCRNCSCVDGEVSCERIQCNDCNNRPPRDCCPECYRRDCIVETAIGTVRIRPGQTWVNPQDRCERIYCGNNLKYVRQNVSDDCPVLDCPADLTIQPMGKCCPVCLLHPCTKENDGQSVSLRNGCRTCTCSNSAWSCNVRIECPSSNCAPENILFSSDDGCCPVCANQVLGANSQRCET